MVYISFSDLKERCENFFLVLWENNELVFEPRCFCGEILEEGFFCPSCKAFREIRCFVCEKPELFSVVQKFTRGSPDFKDFKVYLLEK